MDVHRILGTNRISQTKNHNHYLLRKPGRGEAGNTKSIDETKRIGKEIVGMTKKDVNYVWDQEVWEDWNVVVRLNNHKVSKKAYNFTKT